MFNYTSSEKIVLPVALGVMIIIALILYFSLRHRSAQVKSIPLIVIASLLFGLELVKQVYYLAIGAYDAGIVPLHFCSMFFIWMPMAHFCRGSVGRVGKGLAFTFATWLVVLFYINPNSIIGNSCDGIFSSFYNFHTFVFHHLVMLYWLVFLVMSIYLPKKKDLLQIFIIYTIYCAVAVSVAHLIKYNYTNLLYSNIPFMESIRVSFGQVVYSALMFLSGFALIKSVWWIYYLCKKGEKYNELV